MTLNEKQWLFSRLIIRLIDYAHSAGYEIACGEFHRPPETAALYAKSGKGIANSLHCVKLAADLMLFKDGVYLTRTEDYAALGAYWKSLHPSAAWGGDFKARPDGGHYSIEHEGRA